MPQVLFSLSAVAPSSSNTTYVPISTGTPSFTATEGNATQAWAVAGTLANLLVRLDVAPGAGKSRAFTIRINGVDTALTCTISDTALTARDITHSVSIAAGDWVTLKAVPTGSPGLPSANGVRVAVEFSSTASGESGYGWGSATIASAAPGTKYAPPLTGGGWHTVATDATDVVPLIGTITSLRLWSSTAVGASRSDTCTLYKNGVKQDGSGGTPNTTASLTTGNTTASSSFSLPVAPGDTLYLEGVKVGTGSEAFGYALCLVAATPGQSVVAGGNAGGTVPSSTRYATPGGALGWGSTEATLAFDGAVQSVQLSKLYLRLTAAPGTGKTYTFSLRRNSASPAGTPSILVSDLATTGSDASGTLLVNDTDLWAVRAVPTGTPTAVNLRWAMIQEAVATPLAPAVVTQSLVETLSYPTPDARVTQSVVELLATVVSVAPPTDALVTQSVIELLGVNPPPPTTTVTQSLVELLGRALDTGRVTQLVVEAFVAQSAFARTSQIAVEVFHPIVVPVRATQFAVEYFSQPLTALRASQVIVEVFRAPLLPGPCPVDFPLDVDSVNDCASDFPIDPDVVPY